MTLSDVLTFEEQAKDEELLKSLLGKAMQEALDRLNAAREAEGKRIGGDILSAPNCSRRLWMRSRRGSLSWQRNIRKKLWAKLEEYLQNTEIDENRFQAEILYFTDRASITEEIVRLRSHLCSCARHWLPTRPADAAWIFFVQELNRECNTIGSKSSDVTITKAVLRGKERGRKDPRAGAEHRII